MSRSVDVVINKSSSYSAILMSSITKSDLKASSDDMSATYLIQINNSMLYFIAEFAVNLSNFID